MRIFDAHIYALLLNTHIYACKTHLYLRTKHAYICVPVNLRVLLEGITNSTQRILIRKLEEKQGGMVSYYNILH